MVNMDMVNASASHFFPPPYFCDFSLDSARFLCFKKPVKYNRIFQISQKGPFAIAARGSSADN
jgi:hypothetical protein